LKLQDTCHGTAFSALPEHAPHRACAFHHTRYHHSLLAPIPWTTPASMDSPSTTSTLASHFRHNKLWQPLKMGWVCGTPCTPPRVPRARWEHFLLSGLVWAWLFAFHYVSAAICIHGRWTTSTTVVTLNATPLRGRARATAPRRRDNCRVWTYVTSISCRDFALPPTNLASFCGSTPCLPPLPSLPPLPPTCTYCHMSSVHMALLGSLPSILPRACPLFWFFYLVIASIALSLCLTLRSACTPST